MFVCFIHDGQYLNFPYHPKRFWESSHLLDICVIFLCVLSARNCILLNDSKHRIFFPFSLRFILIWINCQKDFLYHRSYYGLGNHINFSLIQQVVQYISCRCVVRHQKMSCGWGESCTWFLSLRAKLLPCILLYLL